ncbi:MAG: hypothetical protein NPIRA02_19140 [Nitrospirales bacterium]|nr:MAG: hypothetical protein NPIRA02_19140 [Nitrospirales bacterium]
MNTKKNCLSRHAVILAGLFMSVGCATNYENSVSSQSFQTPETLTQQSQFTKAAILRGLHDASLFDTHQTTPDSHVETRSLSVSTVSPMPVHLSEQSSQSTIQDHAEKWHQELGLSFFVRGNYEAAAAAYREALRQQPDVAETYVGLGSALRMQNKVPAAIEAYEHALHLEPDSTAALVHLGSIYAEAQTEHQDIEKAKELFQRASKNGDPFAEIALQELRSRS